MESGLGINSRIHQAVYVTYLKKDDSRTPPLSLISITEQEKYLDPKAEVVLRLDYCSSRLLGNYDLWVILFIQRIS